MERRDGLQIGLAIVAAAAIGFVVALLAFGRNDSNNNAAGTSLQTTTTTTTSGQGTTTTATNTASTTSTTPQTAGGTPASCIELWNQPANRGAQTFLANLASRQPVRVHAGTTTDAPPKCLITVIANNGNAYVFPEGGGTTYPYAPAPSQTSDSTLPPAQKTENALEQRDGTLEAR
ncbi:MAG: hypothetical protein ACJ76Z_04150 [Thermoleophilaceae bacterium]